MGRRKRATTHQPVVRQDVACPLCGELARFHCQDRLRAYFLCAHCALISSDPASHPSAEVARHYYDLHQNDPDDDRYTAFLNQLAEPLKDCLEPGMQGLDYGCGPGPAMAGLLASASVHMTEYDPLYAPVDDALDRHYDVVTCTEVVEHFHQPAKDWAQLVGLVKPGGWLGIMTCLVPDPAPEHFRRWWYKGDPTHVSFYQAHTIRWIAEAWQLRIELLGERVMILQKGEG